MHTIFIFRLLLDFGLVVLIWLVQLVIYPGFKFYASANLEKWHRSYTPRITIVVLPLMTCQLLLAAYQLWQEINVYTSISLSIIVILWLLTFLIFVPLHQAIDKDPKNPQWPRDLERKNWTRTFLWSALFFYSLFLFVK